MNIFTLLIFLLLAASGAEAANESCGLGALTPWCPAPAIDYPSCPPCESKDVQHAARTLAPTSTYKVNPVPLSIYIKVRESDLSHASAGFDLPSDLEPTQHSPNLLAGGEPQPKYNHPPTGIPRSMARVYADVNANMPRSYWDYDSVNISWGVLENYEVVRKIGMSPLGCGFDIADMLLKVGENTAKFLKA